MSRLVLHVPLLLTALGVGWLSGRSDVGVAWAATGREALQLQCRTFKHPLDGSVILETADRTSEIGAWVATARADGWDVAEVDLEVAQNPNGFPQGYVQVCLVRR